MHCTVHHSLTTIALSISVFGPLLSSQSTAILFLLQHSDHRWDHPCIFHLFFCSTTQTAASCLPRAFSTNSTTLLTGHHVGPWKEKMTWPAIINIFYPWANQFFSSMMYPGENATSYFGKAFTETVMWSGTQGLSRTRVSRGNRPIVVPLACDNRYLVIFCGLMTFYWLLLRSITSSCSTWVIVRLYVLPS